MSSLFRSSPVRAACARGRGQRLGSVLHPSGGVSRVGSGAWQAPQQGIQGSEASGPGKVRPPFSRGEGTVESLYLRFTRLSGAGGSPGSPSSGEGSAPLWKTAGGGLRKVRGLCLRPFRLFHHRKGLLGCLRASAAWKEVLSWGILRSPLREASPRVRSERRRAYGPPKRQLLFLSLSPGPSGVFPALGSTQAGTRGLPGAGDRAEGGGGRRWIA